MSSLSCMSGTNYGLVSDKNVGRVGILMRENIFSEDQSTCCLNCWLANSLLKLTQSLTKLVACYGKRHQGCSENVALEVACCVLCRLSTLLDYVICIQNSLLPWMSHTL